MQTTQQEFVRDLTVSDLTRNGACLAFFTAYDDLDTARMIGLAAPDATVHFLPLGDDGRGSFREFGKVVWDLLIDCFPDLTNSVDRLHTEGDTRDSGAITANVTISGTQAKEFMGIAPKGLRFNSDHVFVFRFNEADQIQYLTVNWDHARFVEQLGS